MKEMIRKVYKKFKHLILYGIIGTCASSLDFALFSLLVQLAGLPYLTANCISILAGITTSFTLNRSYNFKVKDKSLKRFSIFLTVGLTGLLLSNLLLYLLIERARMDALWSKLLSIGAVVFFQFLMNKFVTFKEKTP